MLRATLPFLASRVFRKPPTAAVAQAALASILTTGKRTAGDTKISTKITVKKPKLTAALRANKPAARVSKKKSGTQSVKSRISVVKKASKKFRSKKLGKPAPKKLATRGKKSVKKGTPTKKTRISKKTSLTKKRFVVKKKASAPRGKTEEVVASVVVSEVVVDPVPLQPVSDPEVAEVGAPAEVTPTIAEIVDEPADQTAVADTELKEEVEAKDPPAAAPDTGLNF